MERDLAPSTQEPLDASFDEQALWGNGFLQDQVCGGMVPGEGADPLGGEPGSDGGLFEALSDETLSADQVSVPTAPARLSESELPWVAEHLEREGDGSQVPLQDAVASGTGQVDGDVVQSPGLAPTSGGFDLVGAVRELGPKGARLDVSGDRFEVQGRLNPWVRLAAGRIEEVDHDTGHGSKRLKGDPAWTYLKASEVRAQGLEPSALKAGDPWPAAPVTTSRSGPKPKEGEPRETPGAKRRRQLEDHGFNVHSSTPASGRHIPEHEGRALMKSPPGRSFRPRDDHERREQALRQMGTVLLGGYPEGVEVQSLHGSGALVTGTNKTAVNESLRTSARKSGGLGPHLDELIQKRVDGARTGKRPKIKTQDGRLTRGSRTAVNKDPSLRRSIKFRRLMKEKRKPTGVEGIATLMRTQDQVGRFEPGSSLPRGSVSVLGQNRTVPGREKEEHVEVNYLETAKGLEEPCIAGPKCPCATCRQKGFSAGVFSDRGDTGKVFDGQIPFSEGTEVYDESFLSAMETRARRDGTTASSGLQYAQSDSDVDPSESDLEPIDWDSL